MGFKSYLVESLDSPVEFDLTDDTDFPKQIYAIANVNGTQYGFSLVLSTYDRVYTLELYRVVDKKRRFWSFLTASDIRPVLSTALKFLEMSYPIIKSKADGILIDIPGKTGSEMYQTIIERTMRKLYMNTFRVVPVQKTSEKAGNYVFIVKRTVNPTAIFKTAAFHKHFKFDPNAVAPEDLITTDTVAPMAEPYKVQKTTVKTAPSVKYTLGNLKVVDAPVDSESMAIFDDTVSKVKSGDKSNVTTTHAFIHGITPLSDIKENGKLYKYSKIIWTYENELIPDKLVDTQYEENGIIQINSYFYYRYLYQKIDMFDVFKHLMNTLISHYDSIKNNPDPLKFSIPEYEDKFDFAFKKSLPEWAKETFYTFAKFDFDNSSVDVKMNMTKTIKKTKEALDATKGYGDITPSGAETGVNITREKLNLPFEIKSDIDIFNSPIHILKDGWGIATDNEADIINFARQKRDALNEAVPEVRAYYTGIKKLYGGKTVVNYTGSASTKINRSLRNIFAMEYDETKEYGLYSAKSMMRHYEKHSVVLTKSIFLWRNVEFSGCHLYNVGQEIVDPGFLSCSLSSELSIGGSFCKIRIFLPVGSRVLPILSGSNHSSEYEIILPPLSVLQIHEKVSKGSKNNSKTFYDTVYTGTANKSFLEKIGTKEGMDAFIKSMAISESVEKDDEELAELESIQFESEIVDPALKWTMPLMSKEDQEKLLAYMQDKKWNIEK